MDEWQIKYERLQQLMERRQVDAVWLTNVANVAWASGGGRAYIDTTSDQGVATLLVTRDRRYLLTNNIEAERGCAPKKTSAIGRSWPNPGTSRAHSRMSWWLACASPPINRLATRWM